MYNSQCILGGLLFRGMSYSPPVNCKTHLRRYFIGKVEQDDVCHIAPTVGRHAADLACVRLRDVRLQGDRDGHHRLVDPLRDRGAAMRNNSRRVRRHFQFGDMHMFMCAIAPCCMTVTGYSGAI